MGKLKYVAYGLNVESDLDLPGLSRGSAVHLPTVSIRHPRSIDWAEVASRQDGGDFLSLQLADVLWYSVEHGRALTFAVFPGVPQEMADFYLKHTAAGLGFALLLRQRGLLTLHAAVVSKGGAAIGFVGNSGWGKSTLAQFFHQNGYQVLCDDIAAFVVKPDGIEALPGNPVIKLRQGSIDILDAHTRARPRDLDDRLHLHVDAVATDPVPLTRLYLLEKNFAPALSIEAMQPAAQLLELVRHTHGAHLFTRPDYQARMLQQCNTVATHAPMSLLRRAEGLDQLPRLLEIVEEDAGISSHIATASAA